MGNSKRNAGCRAAISCDDFDDWNLVLTRRRDFCRYTSERDMSLDTLTGGLAWDYTCAEILVRGD